MSYIIYFLLLCFRWLVKIICIHMSLLLCLCLNACQPRARVHQSSSSVRPPCTASPSYGCVTRIQTALTALTKPTVVSEALLFTNQSLVWPPRIRRRLWLGLMWILHACTVSCLTHGGSALIKNHSELFLAVSCNNSSGPVLLPKCLI